MEISPQHDLKISEVHKKGSVYPLILQFQNGLLRESKVSGIEGIVCNDTFSEKSLHAVLASEGMVYSGTEMVNNFGHNFIIARNRKTGIVRAIEVGNVLLKASTEKEKKPLDEVDFNKKSLGEVFGSKRSKRMLEQSKRMKIDIDSMKEQLEKTVTEKQINPDEMTEHADYADDNLERYAPPLNRDATTVQAVYKIEDLLSEEEMDTLRSTVQAIAESGTYTDVSSDYVKKNIIRLLESENPQKENLCCLLLYADCIIRYLTAPYKKLANVKYIVCPYSELINTAVLSNFSVRSDRGWARPQSLKDKSICYLLVLLLLSCEYTISDINILSKIINTPVVKLSQMVKVVGARITGDKDCSQVILKLPLSKPPVKSFSKRANR